MAGNKPFLPHADAGTPGSGTHRFLRAPHGSDRVRVDGVRADGVRARRVLRTAAAPPSVPGGRVRGARGAAPRGAAQGEKSGEKSTDRHAGRHVGGAGAATGGFQAPAESIPALDPADAARLIGSAADIALVLDTEGTVRDLSVSSAELSARLGGRESWIGRTWAQLLNQASRGKAALLLADAACGKPARWHHLNHVGAEGADVPVLYAAAPLQAATQRLVVFGRDLRPLSLLQQRLIDTQQTMERDHARMRQLELRYRLVVQSAPEPIVVINAASLRVVEINPACAALLGEGGAGGASRVGMVAGELFAPADRPAIEAWLGVARAAGATEALTVRLADMTAARLTAILLREESTSLLLLRLFVVGTQAAVPEVADEAAGAGADAGLQPALLRLLEQGPDGYVVTDAAGRVLSANAAFVAMAELGRARDAAGQPLDRWLGRAGVDMDVLLSNLRQRGAVRLFGTALTGASGLTLSVEVSAVALGPVAGGEDVAGQDAGEVAAFGFAIRDVERRVAVSPPAREQPRSADQLTELIGRVALKDLVREATDMIERLAIEAALEKTNDNRASAAELLGLSRQSLYVKLHRYGLGDLAEAPN